MKSTLRTPSENVSIEQKSDLIKSEIAKYRMLKSKGVIETNEDIKENKLSTKASTIPSPSHHDFSYRSALTLVQSNSPETVTNTTNSLKSEYWGNSSQKTGAHTMQSFYSGPSVQTVGESFRGSTSHREKGIMENYSAYYSTPMGKNNLNSLNTTNPRNSSSIKSPKNDKKSVIRKSLAPEDRPKDKSFKQIEQFVDTELEREPSDKAKTLQHTFRNGQVQVSVAKSQSKGMNKTFSAVEMRTSSNLETLGKNTRETKNFTPDDDKKTQPETPKSAIARSLQGKKRGGVSGREESKERKTETLGRNVRVMSMKGEGEAENVIQEEIEKWRVFGKMMAESYDALNKKYTEYMGEKEKDKKIISALKEQVNTLKNLLKEAKEENAKYKEAATKSTSVSSLGKEENKVLMKEIESIKVENKETSKTVEFLKVENDMLKNDLEESQKYKELADHFQKLADSRFKECSALAEEIICLRTDLDRSHSNFLRIQREQGSATKGERMFSGRKLRNVASERESGWSFLAGNNSATTCNKRWSERNQQDWSSDGEEHVPTPVDLSTLPCKEENIILRG